MIFTSTSQKNEGSSLLPLLTCPRPSVPIDWICSPSSTPLHPAPSASCPSPQDDFDSRLRALCSVPFWSILHIVARPTFQKWEQDISLPAKNPPSWLLSALRVKSKPFSPKWPALHQAHQTSLPFPPRHWIHSYIKPFAQVLHFTWKVLSSSTSLFFSLVTCVILQVKLRHQLHRTGFSYHPLRTTLGVAPVSSRPEPSSSSMVLLIFLIMYLLFGFLTGL